MVAQDTTKKRTAAVPDLPQEQLQDQMGPPTRSTSSIPPALSTTECLAAEDTNSDPCFIRSTFYVLPVSDHILNATGLPLAIVATPFSDRGLSPSLPEAPRCSSCETYLNFFTHRNGQRLICNICGHVMDSTCSAALDLPTFEIEKPAGASQDTASFSDAKVAGVIETSAPGRISSNQPSAAQNFAASTTALPPPPHIAPPPSSTPQGAGHIGGSSSAATSLKNLAGTDPTCLQPQNEQNYRAACIFVFDLSLSAAPSLAKEALNICKDPSFGHLYSHVGFFVINTDVSFFSVAPDGNIIRTRVHGSSSRLSPLSLVPSNDISAVSSILISVSEERLDLRPDLVPQFLDILQTLSGAFCGIKVVLVSRSISQTYNYEKFLESVKNTVVSVITEKEREAGDVVRKKTAGLFTNNNSIHALAFHSGGRVSAFKRNEIIPMACEMRRIALTRTAFRVSLRLKVSDGLTKTGVISPAIEENLIVTRLNGMEVCDAVTFELALQDNSSGAASVAASHVSKRQPGTTKYCQLQVLYTDNEGRELRRVFNHAYATGDAAQCFMALSFETIFSVLCKVQALSGESTERGAESVLVRSLAFYRRHCAALTSNGSGAERTSSSGTVLSSSQIVLPDSLKCLPVLVQSIDKNSSDWALSIIKADVEKTVRYFYPRLFSLVEFSIAGRLAVTPCLRLTGKEIKDDEIYVAENGTEILVYVGRDVELALVETFFSQKEEAEDEKGELAISQTPTSFVSGNDNSKMKEDCGNSSSFEKFLVEGPLVLKQTEKGGEAAALCEALKQIMSHYGQEMCVRVVVATEQSDEARFMAYMVEDAVNSRPDYVDYVFGLHFKIQRA